jgi:UDP-GlcNAc:undecaprenyl-phosphate GlcNAc-1-phosphate transferase
LATPIVIALVAFWAATGLVVSLLLTRAMIRVAILDRPNHRSSHEVATPRSGGVAIIVGFLVAMTGSVLTIPGLVVPWMLIGSFLAAAMLLSAVSLADDVKGVRARWKFAAQLVAGNILVAGGFRVEVLSLPGLGTVEIGFLGSLLAVAWILFLTNAYNFMDGINGIAGLTAIVGALGLALVAAGTGNAFVVLCCVAIVAGCVGFLAYNFPAGKIFMGDVGSQFLGLLFGALTLIGRAGDGTAGVISVFVVPMLFAVFAFDVLFTLVRRALAGEKLSEAHRGHLYQLCVRMGGSHVQVTALYAGFGAVQAIVAWNAQNMLAPAEIPLALIPLVALDLVYAFSVLAAARRRGLLAKVG